MFFLAFPREPNQSRSGLQPIHAVVLSCLALLAGCATLDAAGESQSGRRALLINKPDVALGHFQKAAQSDPKYFVSFGPYRQGVWTYVGKSYYIMGKLSEARQALERAQSEHQDDHIAKLYLGLVLLRLSGTQDSQKSLSLEEIVYALNQGVSSARVSALIRQRGLRVEWTNATEHTLRNAKASNSLIAQIKDLGAGLSKSNPGNQAREQGRPELEGALKEILQWLRETVKTSSGEHWDPSGKIRARIQNTLTVNSAKPLDWQTLVEEGEWVGRTLEEEIDWVREDRAREVRELSGDN